MSNTEPNLILSHAELDTVTGRSRDRVQAMALTRQRMMFESDKSLARVRLPVALCQ